MSWAICARTTSHSSSNDLLVVDVSELSAHFTAIFFIPLSIKQYICRVLHSIQLFFITGHKGRWLGAGMVLMALGSFVCVLPQFISKPYSGYKWNAANHTLCGAGRGSVENVQDFIRLLLQPPTWTPHRANRIPCIICCCWREICFTVLVRRRYSHSV